MTQTWWQGVGRTALGGALVRAAETDRSDHLVADPLAAAFVEDAPDVFAAERAGPRSGDLAAVGGAFAHAAVVRTRFFDDELLAAALTVGQVVLLGAGFDTRAFRLDWPATVRVFEVDRPDLLAFKQEVLDRRGAVPRCPRVTVGADLGGDWSERWQVAGGDPAVPTAWLAEGLLVYLGPAEADALLARIDALSPPGSRLGTDHDPGSPLLRVARTLPALADVREAWRGGPDEDLGSWLAAHGWQVREDDADEVGRRYGRPPPAPVTDLLPPRPRRPSLLVARKGAPP